MKALPGLFSAVVLAADRTVPDPVARAAGVGCKALAPVGGIPMVIRVLDALAAARLVGACVLCGPGREIVAAEPLLQARLAAGGEEEITPAVSGQMPTLDPVERSGVVTAASDTGV